MKYWTNEPKILAVGTSLTDQSLSEDLFREMCPSVRLTKIELFSISSSDRNMCTEKSISEKLKLEVLSGNYDIVTVETGVNEISNFKKKPKDFVETIAFRLMELNFIIKDIQSEVKSEVKFVLLKRIPRIDSQVAIRLSKVMDQYMRDQFLDQPNIQIRSLKINATRQEDKVILILINIVLKT